MTELWTPSGMVEIKPDQVKPKPDLTGPILRESDGIVTNFQRVRFESEEAARVWADKCVVRWTWVVGTRNVADVDEDPRHVPYARVVGGAIADTTSHNYKFLTGDVKLADHIEIHKVADGIFAVLPKF